MVTDSVNTEKQRRKKIPLNKAFKEKERKQYPRKRHKYSFCHNYHHTERAYEETGDRNQTKSQIFTLTGPTGKTSYKIE